MPQKPFVGAIKARVIAFYPFPLPQMYAENTIDI